MANTWTWEQVVMNIEGIPNRGAVDKLFTPSNELQTFPIEKGYHNGEGGVRCKAVDLSGNANTGHVLKDKTFYKDSLTKLTGTLEFTGNADTGHVLKDKTFYKNSTTKLTGTMKSHTSGSTAITASDKWGINTTYGPWVYIPENAYYETGYYLNIPWNTIKSSLGDAGTGDVLKDKTFSSTNGVKLTGTVPIYKDSYADVTASGKWGVSNTDGAFYIYIPANGYYQTNYYLEVPFDTCAKKMYYACYRKLVIGNYGDQTDGTYVTSTPITSSSGTTPWYDGTGAGIEHDRGNFPWITVDFNSSTLSKYKKHELFGGAWKLNDVDTGDTDYWIMNANGKCASLSNSVVIAQWAMNDLDGYYLKNEGKNWYDAVRLFLPVSKRSTRYRLYLYIMLTGGDYK